ncbi:hypothetical protein HK17_14230 [Acetobacter indonesiensis]|uniref:Uncharacterized protein n=2 Tax=Acetobacter indonesiensis TaxID=104101 RepID=A0A252AKJ5_9PROT|nr:hypothetical protein HK17_14230 [Acetobacter indonesiensis]
MGEKELNDAMSGGVAAFILSDKPQEADYRRELLKRCVLGALQMWGDLEQEASADCKAMA